MKKLLAFLLSALTVCMLSAQQIGAAPAPVDFDKSQPWDGVNACIEWYVEKDGSSCEIADAYDLYGFSLVVNSQGLGDYLYYDPNYMVIFDTDGDGEVSDEAGYDETRVVAGDLFRGTEILFTNDIDLNNKDWTTIGCSTSFEGIVNGQDHTVKNFRVITSEYNRRHGLKGGTYLYGLFGNICGSSEIKDLKIENETVEVEIEDNAVNVLVGGVTGRLHNVGSPMISNVTVNGLTIKLSGKVNAANVYVGAIVGQHNCGAEQTNIHVTGYEFIDEHTDGNIHTQPDNFQGMDGKSDLFIDCTVEMKK